MPCSNWNISASQENNKIITHFILSSATSYVLVASCSNSIASDVLPSVCLKACNVHYKIYSLAVLCIICIIWKSMHDHWCMETGKNKSVTSLITQDDSLWTTTTSRIRQDYSIRLFVKSSTIEKIFQWVAWIFADFLATVYCVDGQTWKRRNDQNIGFLLLR